MVAQAARDILISINTTGDIFVPLAGLRSKSVNFGSQMVDVTNSDSIGRWQELLGGAGVNKMSVKGSGVFVDDIALGIATDAFYAGLLKRFQITLPGYATFTGFFLVNDLNFAGTYNQEQTYDISLESSQSITITKLA
jgi:TP901-1 family phage major tail protein